MVKQENKFKSVNKGRNGNKFECPLYITKNIPQYFKSQLIDPFIGSFYISSIESDNVWIDKNVYMVCQVPKDI